MIEFRNVYYNYRKKQIISDLSFSAEQGTVTVIAGPNGSGKSTTMSMAAGILKPKKGSISVSGKVGYIPQGIALFEDMSVIDNLRFYADWKHVSVPVELPLGVGRFQNEKVSDLSMGMKKRVSISVALLGDPENLLFDEPSEGLDIVFKEELVQLIISLKKSGRTVLYSGHDTDEYSYFYDNLIYMADNAHQLYTRESLIGNLDDPDEEASVLRNAYKEMVYGSLRETI